MQMKLQNISAKAWAGIIPILLVLQAIFMPVSAKAEDLQCVPFARAESGIEIYGDAHTWWDQADGKYFRGDEPVIGSVLSLKSHGNMALGHVAVVSRIIDERNILLSHSNWSVINGRRGQIERDVAAVDVSSNNDWSQVKIWYAPISALGKTSYPVNGFIYPNGKRGSSKRIYARRSDDNRGGRISGREIRKHGARAPNRNLFAKNETAQLEKAARREARRNHEQPDDLIGDLLDRVGS